MVVGNQNGKLDAINNQRARVQNMKYQQDIRPFLIGLFSGIYSIQWPFVASAGVVVASVPGIGTFPPGESGKRAVKTSTPSFVTNIVCSERSISQELDLEQKQHLPNCADFFPSTVALVQSSGHVMPLCVPRLIIGSMVKHIPGLHSPTALFFA